MSRLLRIALITAWLTLGAVIFAYSLWLGLNPPPAHPDTEQPYQSERGLP